MDLRKKITVFILLLVIIIPAIAGSQTVLPKVTVGVGQANSPKDVAVTLQIVLLLTVLSLAPAIIVLMTSFTRLVVVFSFLRHALATQQAPPNQIIVGLSLFLTMFIMAPTGRQINDNAFQPYMQGQISQAEALKRAEVPIRDFMLRQTREKDLALMVSLSKGAKPKNAEDISLFVLVPAFVISELRIAFQIGFLIYIPFLVLDMVISSVLLSMGMMMLPPMMISLPLKLILFVLVDGWNLIVGSLVAGFN
ncbi:flagellar biosynthetic protein FliP [candidate division KSB1 bacterium]|nr:MAG: flagellar biosynthetic protein FliP [candidate division KSB1 bacterium]